MKNPALINLLIRMGLHIEASMNYAIVVDKGQKALMAVDLESGERVVVSKSKISRFSLA